MASHDIVGLFWSSKFGNFRNANIKWRRTLTRVVALKRCLEFASVGFKVSIGYSLLPTLLQEMTKNPVVCSMKPIAVITPFKTCGKSSHKSGVKYRRNDDDIGGREDNFYTSALQRKLILGKKGRIRYCNVGYNSVSYLGGVLSPEILNTFRTNSAFQETLLRFFMTYLKITNEAIAYFDYEKLSRNCGFHYENMNSERARRHLKNLPKGSFLLRNSSDPSLYLYSLTVKTEKGVTSVRLPRVYLSPERRLTNGQSLNYDISEPLDISSRPKVGLKLDCDEQESKRMPAFASIFHLLNSLRQISTATDHRIACCQQREAREKEVRYVNDVAKGDLQNLPDNFLDRDSLTSLPRGTKMDFTPEERVFLKFNDRPMLALELEKPVIRNVSSLKELALCAFVVRSDAHEILGHLNRCGSYSICSVIS